MTNHAATASPTARALWRLRGMALFMIGPAAGLILVQTIFGMPTTLWWGAGAVSMLMLTLFTGLLIKERRLVLRQMRQTTNRTPLG